MKPTRRKQDPLFADESAPSVDPKVPVRVPATGARLSRDQQTFNRLTSAIGKRRDALAQWEQYLPDLHRRIMEELVPLEDDVNEAQRRLVERLDMLLTSSDKRDRPSKRHRSVVVGHLLAILKEQLQQGSDPILEAIYDRHSATSLAEHRQSEFDEAEAMLGALFGEASLQGHNASNLEELFAHARARAEELDAAQAAKKSQRKAKRGKGPTKAEQAAAKKEQARIEAGRSVREVFRKLASALHPDREPDAAERERKTLLMQRANQAYERKDILALLEIQLEIEQLNAEHLAELPAERLRHYNAVLADQLKSIEAQIDEMLLPVSMDFGLFLGSRSRTKVVDEAFEERIEAMAEMRAVIEADLLRLDDPRQRKALFDEMLDAQWDDFDDWDDFAMLDELESDGFFDEPLTAPAPAKRRTSKKRGKSKKR